MIKYAFKLYLDHATSRQVVPKEIEESNLVNMDLFVLKCGGSFQLIQKLQQEYNLLEETIQKVTIIHKKNQTEFSLCVDNPYLTPVLNQIQRKKIKGYGNYQMEVEVVPITNQTFQKMKEYVLTSLRSNYQDFLTNIYGYQNQFAALMYRYGNIYQAFPEREEDSYEIKSLERELEEKLSIYKNYRGLCIAYRNQERNHGYQRYPSSKSDHSRISRLKISPVIATSSLQLTTQQEANRKNQYSNYLGEEKEEFLEPDELDYQYRL